MVAAAHGQEVWQLTPSDWGCASKRVGHVDQSFMDTLICKLGDLLSQLQPIVLFLSRKQLAQLDVES
jgi:hypothetical protein